MRQNNRLNVNRIKMIFSSKGGLEYPNGLGQSDWNGWGQVWDREFVFDQGLWVMGKRNGAVGWLPYIWWSPYSPGPLIAGQPAMMVQPQDSLRYRVYGITYGDTPELNSDIHAWPADLGAPVDNFGKPILSGDQTVWTVYNGMDTSKHLFFRYNPVQTPLPIEVHQKMFEHFGEFSDTSIWANTVFMEWSIYNKGPDPLDSVFLSLWTDLDFIDPGTNFPGIDTTLQTGYCWYSPDSSFGSVGYVLLYGPTVPSPGDTAISFGLKRSGYRNLPLYSFWPIEDDSYPDSSAMGPPYSIGTAWNVVRGYTQRGAPIIDSSTHKPTHFPLSGDPLTHRGSLYPYQYVGGGGGFMMNTGPCSLAPGDSQWIMIALIPSVKLNGVDALTRMRRNAQYLRSLPYDSLVSRKPRRSVPIDSLPTFNIPSSFALGANFPNPFNGTTIFPFNLPERSHIRLEAFDVLGRLAGVITDQVLERGPHNIPWLAEKATGVYFVRLRATSLEHPISWNGTRKVLLLR